MRHPDIAHPALVPASAVPQHRALGWIRVSGAIPAGDVDQVDVADYAQAPDLDAEPPAAAGDDPDPTPAPARRGKTTKE